MNLKLNWIIGDKKFSLSSSLSCLYSISSSQRFVNCLNIPFVFIDEIKENWSRVVAQQKLSFYLRKDLKIACKMFFSITTVMSLICVDIRRVAIEKGIFGISALNYLVGIVLFDLCFSQTFSNFLLEVLYSVLKSTCCFFFIVTPTSNFRSETLVGDHVKSPSPDKRGVGEEFGGIVN